MLGKQTPAAGACGFNPAKRSIVRKNTMEPSTEADAEAAGEKHIEPMVCLAYLASVFIMCPSV